MGLVIAPAPAFAQPAGDPRADASVRADLRQLREHVDRRFEVVELRRGLILVPKSESSRARTVEVTEGQVLVDGSPVTGRELRDRLGEDSGLVLRLSFLDAEGRRTSSQLAPGSRPRGRQLRRHQRSRAAVVRGARRLERDRALPARRRAHSASGATSASPRTKPSVTTWCDPRLGARRWTRGRRGCGGGRLRPPGSEGQRPRRRDGRRRERERSVGATVSGQINEVQVSAPTFGPIVRARPGANGSGSETPFRNPFGGSVDLITTLVRIGLVGLFAALMVAVVPGPVRRVAERVTAEPWRAGLVGLAAQLLFVPLLVLTVVVLAVSIIGSRSCFSCRSG